MLLDELRAKGVVDQQAGEHEKGRAGHVQQRAHRVGEDVIEPRTPAVRPDVAEGGHDAIGDDRLEIVAARARGD